MTFTFGNRSFKGSSFQEKLQQYEKAELTKTALLNADLGLKSEQIETSKDTIVISSEPVNISTVFGDDIEALSNASTDDIISALEKSKFGNVADAVTSGGITILIDLTLIKNNEVELKLSDSQKEKVLQQAQNEEKVERVKSLFSKEKLTADYDTDSNSFYCILPEEKAKEIREDLIAKHKSAGLVSESSIQLSKPSGSKVMLSVDLNKLGFTTAPTLSAPSVAESADAKTQFQPGGKL